MGAVVSVRLQVSRKLQECVLLLVVIYFDIILFKKSHTISTILFTKIRIINLNFEF